MGITYKEFYGTLAYNGVIYPVNNGGSGGSGGSSLTNILYDVVKLSNSKLKISSYIWLANELSADKITVVNCTVTDIIRDNDFLMTLQGDFSNLEESGFVEIITSSGLFIDKNAISNNMAPIGAVRTELEFTTAGQLISVINGRTYTKVNDGLAIGGYMYGSDLGFSNYTGPFLISEISGAASYTEGENYSYTNYEGNTWYDSGRKLWMAGNRDSTDGPALKLNNIPEIAKAVKQDGIDIRDAILMYYKKII